MAVATTRIARPQLQLEARLENEAIILTNQGDFPLRNARLYLTDPLPEEGKFPTAYRLRRYDLPAGARDTIPLHRFVSRRGRAFPAGVPPLSLNTSVKVDKVRYEFHQRFDHEP